MRTTLPFMIGALTLAGAAWAQPAAVSAPATAAAEGYTPMVGQGGKDVMWVPTAQTLVDRMLDMAKLTPQDHLIDLGSGDGRLVITAAKRGATARGIEYNPDMVALSKRLATAEGVSSRATFEKADIFQSDFSKATVLTMFLLPEINFRLRPTVLAMKPGTRVVSNSFDMGDWQPDEKVQVRDNCQTYCDAFKWTVPARVGGEWVLDGHPLKLVQTYQFLTGELASGGAGKSLSEARLHGTRIEFNIGTDRYVGEVSGREMRGTVNGTRAWRASASKLATP